MARRRYIMMYDIADEVRLRRIAKLMEGYGSRLQYSVFLCDLSSMEVSRWQVEVQDTMNLREDSVVWVDIGAPVDDRIQTIGVPRTFPPSGPLIF